MPKFQKLNEDSRKAFEKMTLAADEKDQQIGVLFRQLGELQQQIQKERADTAQVTAKMELSQQDLEAQINELNKALEDAMTQVDGLDEERRSLKQQLTQTKEVLGESKATIAVLEEKSEVETNKLNGEMEELCRELEESQKGSEEVSQQLEGTKALLEEATCGQENAKSQATETSNVLNEIKNTLSNERLRREELERRVRELERDLQTTEEERDNARCNMLDLMIAKKSCIVGCVKGIVSVVKCMGNLFNSWETFVFSFAFVQPWMAKWRRNRSEPPPRSVKARTARNANATMTMGILPKRTLSVFQVFMIVMTSEHTRHLLQMMPQRMPSKSASPTKIEMD